MRTEKYAALLDKVYWTSVFRKVGATAEEAEALLAKIDRPIAVPRYTRDRDEEIAKALFQCREMTLEDAEDIYDDFIQQLREDAREDAREAAA